jgi:hypothetical protein
VRSIVLVLCGCAEPLIAVRTPAEVKAADIVVTYCGSASVTAGEVIRTMDNLGQDPGAEGKSQATVCLRVENKGKQALKVDRSLLALKRARESEPAEADTDDEQFVVPPLGKRQFHVTFDSTMMSSGEEVALEFGKSMRLDSKVVQVPSLALRKK